VNRLLSTPGLANQGKPQKLDPTGACVPNPFGGPILEQSTNWSLWSLPLAPSYAHYSDTLPGLHTSVRQLPDGRFELTFFWPSGGGTTNDGLCTPWTMSVTLGQSSVAGPTVFTNPSLPGFYTFWVRLASEWNADDDAWGNQQDNCQFVANDPQTDSDGDFVGDDCDPNPGINEPDLDLDGSVNTNQWDNCPLTPNGGQTDTDGDDLGDACDPNPASPTGTQWVQDCYHLIEIDGLLAACLVAASGA
jgi:hypothetical protein